MKERELDLIDMDLQLVAGTDLATLSLGVTRHRARHDQPPKVQEVLRIVLTIEQLRTMVDHMASAASYRARIVPPSSTSH